LTPVYQVAERESLEVNTEAEGGVENPIIGIESDHRRVQGRRRLVKAEPDVIEFSLSEKRHMSCEVVSESD
jgi:hypothetical protein